jgi:hypothetical protein
MYTVRVPGPEKWELVTVDFEWIPIPLGNGFLGLTIKAPKEPRGNSAKSYTDGAFFPLYSSFYSFSKLFAVDRVVRLLTAT